MGKVQEHRDICDDRRLPGMMTSPWCERKPGHQPADDHYGCRQHWSVTPEQMTLREQEIFKASLDRILDWPGASHVDLVVYDGEVKVKMQPRLYDALMHISYRTNEDAVLLELGDFDALTSAAEKRINAARVKAHEQAHLELISA